MLEVPPIPSTPMTSFLPIANVMKQIDDCVLWHVGKWWQRRN